MPIKLYDEQSRQLIEAPESDVPALLSTGRYQLDLTADYNLVDPEGKTVGSVKGDKLLPALKTGLRLEAPEESARRAYEEEMKGDSRAPFQALAAGAARGLTLGLSDYAMTKTGLVAPEHLEALRQVYPTSSLTSEIIGNTAGALLTGGGSAAAKLLPSAQAGALARAVGGRGAAAVKALTGAADVAGETLAKRALAKSAALVTAGAVEGSLVGIGQAITEDSLGDPRTFGEILGATLGPNMLVGAGVGVLGAAASTTGLSLSKLATKGEKAISEIVGEQAPKLRTSMAFKSLGVTEKQAFSNLGEKKARAAVDTLLDPSVLDDGQAIVKAGADTEEILSRGAMAVRNYGKNVESVIAGLDDVATKLDEGVPNMVPRTEMVREGATLRQSRLIGGEVSPERTSLLNMEEMPSKKRIAERINQLAETEFSGKRPYKQGYKELRSIADELLAEPDNYFYTFREAQAQKVAYGSSFDAREVLQGSKLDAWRKVYKIYSEEIEDSAERMLNKIGQPEIFDQYKRSKEIYYALKDAMDMAGGKWLEAGNSFVRELTKGGKDFVHGLGWRMIYSGRGVESAARMSATAMGIREGMRQASYYVKPSRIANLANDTAKLRLIQERAQQFTSKVERNVDKLLKLDAHQLAIPASVRILNDVTGKRDEQKAWKQFRSEMMNLTPEKLAVQVGASLEGLETVAPNISIEAGATMARAAKVIKEAMPIPFNAHTLQPTLEEFDPTPGEMSVFKRVVAAALQPESVLEDIQQGVLTPEAVNTVATVYPQFHELLKETIAEKLAAKKEKVPYNLRYQLSVLFDLPTDPTLEQDFIQRSQLAWAPQAKPEQRGTPPKYEEDGAAAKLNKTTAQRIEGGVG